jgi:gas vesicle protein
MKIQSILTGGTLAGLVTGAALMYLLDPERGRRRRAVARDKITSNLRRLRRAAEAKARDLRNRTEGAIAESSRALRLGQRRGEPDVPQSQ